MRYFSKILTGLAAVAILALAVTPVLAVSQTFQGAVRDLPTTDQFSGNCAWSRSWSGNDLTQFNNPICQASGACVQPGDNSYCRRTFAANISATGTGGYNTQQDDITTYASGADGQTVFGLLEQLKGGGTSSYVSYYSIASQIATAGETGNLGNDACTGATLLSSFCPGSNTRRAAAQPNTRLGSLAPLGGFNPIPAPRITSISGGNANLTWDAAFTSNTKDGTTIPFKGYNVYRFNDTNNNGICEPPADTAAWAKLAQVVGTSTSQPLGAGDCAFYALRLVFNGPTSTKNQGPDAGPAEVTTINIGVSSPGAKINPSAVVISNFGGVYVGKSTFRLSWITGSESGIAGFYLKRSTSPNGTFDRVGDMIPAAGQDGSAYSTLDKVTRKMGSTFYYQLEVVMTDNTSVIGASTSLTLPKPQNKQ